MLLSVNRISFTGNNNNDDDRRIRATEVGVGAGATVGGAKYGVNAFKQFNSAKKVVKMSGESVKAVRDAAKVGKQTKSLWRKMFKDADTFRDVIINWGKSAKMPKWLKPVFQGKVFDKVSGVLGGVTAAFVFISGIGEMGQTFGKLADKQA